MFDYIRRLNTIRWGEGGGGGGGGGETHGIYTITPKNGHIGTIVHYRGVQCLSIIRRLSFIRGSTVIWLPECDALVMKSFSPCAHTHYIIMSLLF